MTFILVTTPQLGEPRQWTSSLDRKKNNMCVVTDGWNRHTHCKHNEKSTRWFQKLKMVKWMMMKLRESRPKPGFASMTRDGEDVAIGLLVLKTWKFEWLTNKGCGGWSRILNLDPWIDCLTGDLATGAKDVKGWEIHDQAVWRPNRIRKPGPKNRLLDEANTLLLVSTM